MPKMPMPKKDDIVFRSYRTLGLPVGATRDEIRSAYRKLVKLCHPDVFRGDMETAEAKVKSLNAAFRHLKSASASELSAAEEVYRSRVAGKRRPKPASARPRSKSANRAYSRPAPGTRRRRGPQATTQAASRNRVAVPAVYKPPAVRRGRHSVGEVELTRRESFHGARWKLVLPTCLACGGWGSDLSAELEVCGDCRGLGLMALGEGGRQVRPCLRCSGYGCHVKRPCEVCGGSISSTVYTAQFSIAPGIGHDFCGLVDGLGHPGVGGAPPGDLYLFIVPEA